MTLKIKKLIRIVSEHKKSKSAGQMEAIVQLEDGTLTTRHLYPSQLPAKEKP